MSERIALGAQGSLGIAAETYADGAIAVATSVQRLLWGANWVFSFDEPLVTFEDVQTEGTLENAPIDPVQTNARATMTREGILDLSEIPMALHSALGVVAATNPTGTSNTHLFVWNRAGGAGFRPVTWSVWGIDRDTDSPQNTSANSFEKAYCTEFTITSAAGNQEVTMSSAYAGANPQRDIALPTGHDTARIGAEQLECVNTNSQLISGSSFANLVSSPTPVDIDINSIAITFTPGNVAVEERNGNEDFSYTRVRNGKRMLTLSITAKVNIYTSSFYKRMVASKKAKTTEYLGMRVRGKKIETANSTDYFNEFAAGAAFKHTTASMQEVGTTADADERIVQIELQSIQDRTAGRGTFFRLQTEQATYP